MDYEFPGAVPEIPVTDLDVAGAYYKNEVNRKVALYIPNRGSAPCRGSCTIPKYSPASEDALTHYALIPSDNGER